MGLSYAIVPYITERNKMIKDKTFRITYKKSNGETVTRFGKWTDKCRVWTSKIGSALMTYYDLDAQGYRTAKNKWEVRY
jgi:hypothetical protein